MRPYLAIIKDSFKAALASRVLYVLLGLILLFLALIAPLHVRESLDTKIILKRDVRVSQQALLASRVKEQMAANHQGMQRIWDSLSPATRNKVNRATRSDNQSGNQKKKRKKNTGLDQAYAAQSIVDELNTMIEDPQFFRQQDWQGTRYNLETKGYLDKGVDSLSALQQQRLNRILISQSFVGLIDAGSSSSLDFFYGPFDWSDFFGGAFPMNLSHSQFASEWSSFIGWFLDKIVLSIGLLIAILVTANIVPQTFEAGTLNLLLSKPVSRAGLFLAKFAGGCMFIALCATLLFVGLWLWSGFALGIWERAMLFSIPLYVIVFAVYYSVSSLTGLVTRSTIMAIIATGVFWALCWSMGMIYGYFNARMEGSEIAKVANTKHGLMVSPSGLTDPQQWDAATKTWNDINLPPLDEEEAIQRMVVNSMGGLAELPFPASLGPVSSENGSLTVLSRVLAGDVTTHLKQQCFVADETNLFQRKGSLPSGALTLVATQNEILCINGRGRFYRFNPDMTFDKKLTGRESWFVAAGPMERVSISDAQHVTVKTSSGEIAIYDQGTVTTYAINESDPKRAYEKVRSRKIDTGTRDSMTCYLAWQGDSILLALGNGQVIVLDAANLETKYQYLPETRVAIDSISASPDGRWFSLLYKDETLRLFDADNPGIVKPSIRGQGSISAIHFDASSMVVADRTDRVTRYALDDFSQEEAWSPEGTWLTNIWRYGIKPLYAVFPKPGEFYKVVGHLSSSNDSRSNSDVDLTLQPVRPNPWSPLISGLAFMAVVLGVSCLVFSRTDY